MIFTNLKHPEWFNGAADQMVRMIALMKASRLPSELRGRFIVTSCLRMLRVVYGTNESAVEALKQHIQEHAESNPLDLLEESMIGEEQAQ
jgi:hypothetical protein